MLTSLIFIENVALVLWKSKPTYELSHSLNLISFSSGWYIYTHRKSWLLSFIYIWEMEMGLPRFSKWLKIWKDQVASLKFKNQIKNRMTQRSTLQWFLFWGQTRPPHEHLMRILRCRVSLTFLRLSF